MKLKGWQIAYLLIGVTLVLFLLRKTSVTPARPKREIDPDAQEMAAFEDEIDLYGEGWYSEETSELPSIPISNVPYDEIEPPEMDDIGGVRIPRYRRPDGIKRRKEDERMGQPPERAQLDIAIFNGTWQRDDRRREDRMVSRIGRRANVLLGVETYDMNIRDYLSGEWDILQNRQDKGKANASIATRDVRVLDRGYAETVKPLAGVKLRQRFIAWEYLKISDGTIIRVGAYHRPPARFAWTWPLYDRAVIAWLNITRQPTVLGGDFNARTLERITRATGYRYINRGVMGALISPDLRVVDRWSDQYLASDHDVMGFTVRKKR